MDHCQDIWTSEGVKGGSNLSHPSGAMWLHEIKRKTDKGVKLYSRPGNGPAHAHVS
jgi:hypothetical protein